MLEATLVAPGDADPHCGEAPEAGRVAGGAEGPLCVRLHQHLAPKILARAFAMGAEFERAGVKLPAAMSSLRSHAVVRPRISA